MPTYPGAEVFGGDQLHSAGYRSAGPYAGQRVVVVGGGNSGAQDAADLALHGPVTWCTLRPPRFLPDNVDGRRLFRVATLRAPGHGEGVGGLGDIVAVPPVRAARDAGRLASATLIGVGQWALRSARGRSRGSACPLPSTPTGARRRLFRHRHRG